MAVVNVFHIDPDISQKFPDLFYLLFGNLGDHFQFPVRIPGDDACGRGGRHTLEMAGVGDDHALYIFDNAAAYLQENPVRGRAERLAGFGRGVRKGDGLGTAESGDQFFFQDIYVSLVADVIFIHVISTPSKLFCQKRLLK